jgi:hypothetical protein
MKPGSTPDNQAQAGFEIPWSHPPRADTPTFGLTPDATNDTEIQERD